MKLWVVLALLPCALAAQVEIEPRNNWQDHLYPYGWYSSIDGWWLGGHYDWTSPIGFAERPEPNYARVSLDAAASTEGSYSVVLDGQAPAYWEGWRFDLALYALRSNRLGYYGEGNTTTFDKDSTAGRQYFYNVSRTSQAVRATIQRRIVGPLRLMVGGTLEHTDFRELPGGSVFQRDVANGTIGTDEIPFSDAVARAGLVLDLRDLERDPHRGLFAEALISGGRGYTRTSGSVRGYVNPLRRLVLAGRVAAEGTSGSPPISAQFTMESADRPFNAVGGYRSLRGYHDGRFLGPGKLVAGVEARYGVLWSPRVMELKLVAFYEAGRVFAQGEPVRLTREGMHSAWGGGAALALLRNTLFTFMVGIGHEESEVMFATSWSY